MHFVRWGQQSGSRLASLLSATLLDKVRVVCLCVFCVLCVFFFFFVCVLCVLCVCVCGRCWVWMSGWPGSQAWTQSPASLPMRLPQLRGCEERRCLSAFPPPPPVYPSQVPETAAGAYMLIDGRNHGPASLNGHGEPG